MKTASLFGTVQQIVEICRNRSELFTLYIGVQHFEPSKENILEFVQNGKKLQSSHLAKRRVDTDYYTDLLKFVENRREKTFLEIIFREECVIDVSNDLTASNRESLSVVVQNSGRSRSMSAGHYLHSTMTAQRNAF